MDITAGTLTISNVIRKDMLDITFPVENIDLTGKTVKSQWREAWDLSPVLTFQQSDNTLVVNVQDDENATIRLYQKGSSMIMKAGTYQLSVIMYTTADDRQTIFTGTATVVDTNTD